jgi:hypothetical protein
MTRPTFAQRLAAARAMIAGGAADVPGHLADQIRAAGAETRHLHDRMGAVLPLLEPGRNWRPRVDADPSDTTRAYLLAALFGCTTVCPHLRTGGPQPAIARLPLRRIDCGKCSQTFRRPPTGEADQCDICQQPEVLRFWPFAVRQGPVLIAGDACGECADLLGISEAAAAS